MSIKLDIHLEKYNGDKLNAVEKYELEKQINITLVDVIRHTIEETIPSYIKYRGSEHRLIGHKKEIVDILK